MPREERRDAQPLPEVFYTIQEEIAHSVTHGIGVALSIIGLTWLVGSSTNFSQMIAFSVYGTTSTFLYLASTLYHSFQQPHLKRFFRMMDHVGIYLLIAGSYTPFLLLRIRNLRGWILLAVIWILALMGSAFKTLAHNPFRFERYSVATYLGMGWLSVFVLWDILLAVPFGGIVLLALGGACYTAGIIFYNWETLPYNHAIWHLFVLGGSICHYFAVLTLAPGS